MRRLGIGALSAAVAAVVAVACGGNAGPHKQASGNNAAPTAQTSVPGTSLTPSSTSPPTTADPVPPTLSPTTPSTSITAPSPIDGTYALSAAADQCALNNGALAGQTLTVKGPHASVTNPYGIFEGSAQPEGGRFHIVVDFRPTKPDAASGNVRPPSLDMFVNITGPNTIGGTDQFSGVNPGGETGFGCDRIFTGIRTSSAPSGATSLLAGPPYSQSGPSGSGCAPPNASSLPDGWWAGLVVGRNGTSINFDLVCYFSGDAANAAAAADGKPTPVEDDVYIRNNNPKTFLETFASVATPAACVNLGAQHFPCTVGELLDVDASPGQADSHDALGVAVVWLHVTNGAPDFLYAQFHP